MYSEGLSASDVALLSGNNGRSNDGFGNGNGWWIIIFLIFAFGGWGNDGWNNRGNSGGSTGTDGIATMYTLNSDFATLQRLNESGFDRLGNQISNVNNGLCDGFYAVNTAFGNLNTNLCSQFGNTNNLITSNGYESRLATQSLASQLATCCCDIRQNISDLGYKMQDCCCQTQRSIDGVNSNIQGINYNMAMNTNQLQNAMCNNTRDIIQSNECGTRAILDAITQNRIEDKNAQIQAQQARITALELAASQANQTNELISTLRPCPIPAYQSCNPWATSGYGGCGNCG